MIVNLNTVVVGSGAAGFNAAIQLHKNGVENIAIVTEGVHMGTSRNTGSDKQTYYKQGLCGEADSPYDMAKDLFDGKSVDGDVALAEAAGSLRCFMQLCELGVEFPVNRYGEFVGYKTDHDTRGRASSAGPLTSRMMTEALEREAHRRSIKIYNGLMVISVIKDGDNLIGLLALDKKHAKSEKFVLFNCTNVIYATGGPAGIYSNSVYPRGHSGGSGVALLAGIRGQNLTEWQYGLASVEPRWNVSGTYMQVLPKFISIDKEGVRREFLRDYFSDDRRYLSMLFKKGYEWPFDSRKARNGSSIIDLLCYREQAMRGRTLFLDFSRNPCESENLDFDMLEPETYDYLKNADAIFGKPIDRLLHMNFPAYQLYLGKGVDLKTDLLPIALCAQHNNGGLAVDLWWQSNLKGFFCAGEAAGTHGVYRPGGSALNAGQVGSYRAATFIASRRNSPPLAESDFLKKAEKTVEYHQNLCDSIVNDESNAEELLKKASKRMSKWGGAIRNKENMKKALEETDIILQDFKNIVRINSSFSLVTAYRLRDVLLAQSAYLSAMLDFSDKTDMSRGSALYSVKDGEGASGLPEDFKYKDDDGSLDDLVQETYFENGRFKNEWRQRRPLPSGGGFFENVWREYRENKNIY